MDARGLDSKGKIWGNVKMALSFYKGGRKVSNDEVDPEATLRRVQRDLGDVFNSKHLAFLFGSGCSSSFSGGREVGIPTMGPMAKGFLEPPSGPSLVTDEECTNLQSVLGIDIKGAEYASNLEALMEVLHSYSFILKKSTMPEHRKQLSMVQGLIARISEYVLKVCTEGPFSSETDRDNTVLNTYQAFYRKLLQRDRSLTRPWVFTTNYDLFSETAMDRLGIPYINGFQGSVERRFNPATFRYALAEQLDLANRKWSSVESLIYFVKLHGSVSWESRDDGLFPVVETHPALLKNKGSLLIYPTPAKQNASFASPYSDMFRELQVRVAREQSAFVTIGYSFSDEHVNNIIFQALTIPTFRLVAFVAPDANANVQRLLELNDPRIWIIGSEGASSKKAHYFANVVEDLMPAEAVDDARHAIEQIVDEIARRRTSEEGGRQ